MLSIIREAPFLPKLASPSVQTSYDIDRSQTSYHEQFKGHTLDRRPRNYSVEHHAKHRQDFALTHPDDPKDHYTTSTMSVTSPDRRADLLKVTRPAAYPHEIKEPLRTSRFQFQTTNEELFSSQKGPHQSPADAVAERRKEQEELRAKRAKSKAGSLRFDTVQDDTARVPPAISRRSDSIAHSHELDDRWMLTSKQMDEQRTQSHLNAANLKTSSSHNNSSSNSRYAFNQFRPLPCSFPDEIQLDHSHLGLDAGVSTSYQSNSTSVREFWNRGATERKNVLSPPRALHCALPSISLAYAVTPKGCDHCGSTFVKRNQSMTRATNGRASVMQSTYQTEMGDPLRSKSSLF
jgi:hypothetical protein